MDGQLVDGRPLTVRLRSERGQPRERRPLQPEHSFDHHRPAPGEVDETKLYVHGLTKTVQEHALRELFAK